MIIFRLLTNIVNLFFFDKYFNAKIVFLSLVTRYTTYYYISVQFWLVIKKLFLEVYAFIS